jgi:predicted DNA-binding transcriptional regulator YafY
MDGFADVAFAQRQRLHFIETLALWDGTVQRERVSESFGVALAQVTRDFTTYREHCPDNLAYNNRLKVYQPTPQFQPVLAAGDPDEYLALLRAGINVKTVAQLPSLGLHHGLAQHVSLPAPRARVLPRVLREVLSAIQRSHGLEVRYLSMETATPTSRALWPHGLFFSGEWWYVRAFDSKRQEFRNFALHRFDGARTCPAPSPSSSDRDEGWHGKVELIVIPDARLTEAQQALVARDFGMSKDSLGWAWKAHVKKCLVGFFAAHYWLDVQLNRPRRTRLSLRNRSELEPYFFRPSSVE